MHPADPLGNHSRSGTSEQVSERSDLAYLHQPSPPEYGEPEDSGEVEVERMDMEKKRKWKVMNQK